jgi:hypothetical protein
MPVYSARIVLNLIGPILTKSSAPGAYGVDSVCARNAAGNFMLPWTMVKGLIREAWSDLYLLLGETTIPNPATYLGPDPSKGGNRENPGAGATGFTRFTTRIFGTDFVLVATAGERKPRESARQTRIAQDKKRHAAQEDMFQVIEAPFTAGEKYEFAGTITYEAPNEQVATDLKRLLIKSLRWAGAFGSLTSVGFGQLGANLHWGCDNAPAVALPDPRPGERNMWLRFTATQPLCITAGGNADNLFVSGSTIPGGMIKGAVAAQMVREAGGAGSIVTVGDDATPLQRHFEQIRFAHSHPHAVDAAVRPAVIPLSLARTVQQTTRDMAEHAAPPSELGALSFQVDWKDADWSAVAPRFGWTETEKELRVRTAIDGDSRRAKTGNLFAYEMLVPQQLAWDCRVSIPAGVSDADVRAIRAGLAQLLARGLRGVGKTKATLQCEILAQALSLCREEAIPCTAPFIITLQTPALLVAPSVLRSRSRDALKLAYAETFAELSHGHLTLTNFFAQQVMYGGLYLHMRFQSPAPYAPYALTKEGSVFVFDSPNPAAAVEELANWRRDGLPLPAWVKAKFGRQNGHSGDHWSNNPFVPENGYGEIAANLDTTNIDANPGVAHAGTALPL